MPLYTVLVAVLHHGVPIVGVVPNPPSGETVAAGVGIGYLLVATGRAEVMLDPIMKIWDIAPLFPIIAEAGSLLIWREMLQEWENQL